MTHNLKPLWELPDAWSDFADALFNIDPFFFIPSCNQLTVVVWKTHQGSQQTMGGKATYIMHWMLKALDNRELSRNCGCNAVFSLFGSWNCPPNIWKHFWMCGSHRLPDRPSVAILGHVLWLTARAYQSFLPEEYALQLTREKTHDCCALVDALQHQASIL